MLCVCFRSCLLWQQWLPERLVKVIKELTEPEYVYKRWCEEPLYNTVALRLDHVAYRKHKKHFFESISPLVECPYCVTEVVGNEEAEQAEDDHVYVILGRCPELPRLEHSMASAKAELDNPSSESMAEHCDVLEQVSAKLRKAYNGMKSSTKSRDARKHPDSSLDAVAQSFMTRRVKTLLRPPSSSQRPSTTKSPSTR
eukprot:NODE_23458_length_665_cov_4.711896.p1 GENE.NODE_23458_length_665_cov_4.711896~~NODE_23458_length_665_cov_4.711896.p1  ORF type:complete len:219 (+),score=21.41 NODE_23458_length_665_cov_4.711896:66-659(+)